MIYQLKPYWDALLSEHTSSWAVIAILYLLAGLLVRSWFIGPLFGSLKTLEKGVARELRKKYLAKSLTGWFFFLLPPALLAFLWRNEAIPLKIDENILIIAGAASFGISVVLHLIAFGLSGTATLKKVSETQEKKLFEA